MDKNQVDDYAKTLWKYLQLHETPTKSDIIFCLCSHDIRVAERAAQLMLDGFGEYLVFSGGVGALTEGMFDKSEAEAFADVAEKMGVSSEKVITETKSTNTGENVRLTYDLLKEKDIEAGIILLVQKPYMERRTYATFKKQWPNPNAVIHVTSPQIGYEDYMEGGGISKDHILNVMVGDMQRIREYPRLGFQIEQVIPDDVWHAYQELINLGFNKHLIVGNE